MENAPLDQAGNTEYAAAKRNFQEAHDAGTSIRNEAYIADAIMVFCIEAMAQDADTLQAKSARVIASRLMGLPDDEKEWLVTFPYVWMKKDATLTKSEKKRRTIGFAVAKLVAQGSKVTHAIAKVATDFNFSPQKVTADYYAWAPKYQKLKELVSSNSAEEKIE